MRPKTARSPPTSTPRCLLDSHGNVLASRTHGFFRCGAVDFEANPEAANLGTGTYYLRVVQNGEAPLGRAYRFRVWLIQR